MNTLNIPEYKVSQFNFQIKDLIENNFNYVRISGEISEIKNASKGQLYMTLKDDQSILSCVVWSQKMKNLLFNPELGMQVIATGKITTWSKYKTTYQLDIDKIVIFSSIGKIEGDCVKMARRDLYVSYHDKKMGKGNVVSEDKRTSEWIYNKPGSVWYETLKFVCNSKR